MHPGTRVEWVTPDQVWVEGHAQNIHGALPWDMISSENTYPQGQDHPPRLVPSGYPARLQPRLRGGELPLAGLHDLERPGVELVTAT